MPTTYSLNETESAALKKFQQKHFKKCHAGTSVTFTETGIGLRIDVCCLKCKKEKDISDYGSW